ncbi:uncharacterized protein LOC121370986 isoform X2 [Gigantopelta aegis]|uniref:uncharacterized protein LOC121370986 isoform X2 n=1 Tax=Gigantopelta aegis TaxID=1735272 RepID=UPI001B88E74B|nr:uncharacterized protein LOC121370986 isoform X2 [Gigantopelta aegis]
MCYENRRQATMPDSKHSRCPNLIIYLQCYFVTIATILGTGILGLPVTLTKSGLYPFLITFITSALMQVLLIYYFTDLLQKAYASQLDSKEVESFPLKEMEGGSDDSSEDELSIKNGVITGKMILRNDRPALYPNLHMLGELYLGCGVRQSFDILIILQFVALLICYALAGSEAFAELVGVRHIYVIPGFVWLLSFAVVFALKFIQPIVSILTFVKGSLLLGTTIVTFFVGLSVGQNVSTDFAATGAPFLMGTVALGGIINTMPFIYEKIEFKKEKIKNFRLSVLLGMITCTVLNILWCWAVLEIVPQTIEMACYKEQTHLSLMSEPNVSMTTLSVLTTPREVCTGELSLESAEKNGEISTLPLTKILHRYHPSKDWVAFLIELFIVISILVSYLTIGTALHHTLSGWVESCWMDGTFSRFIPNNKDSTFCSCINGKWLCMVVISLLAFCVVFAVAMLDPQGFVDILEKFASFTLNLQAGVYIFMMLLRANNQENRNVMVPLPIPSWMKYLQFLLPLTTNSLATQLLLVGYLMMSSAGTTEFTVVKP